MFFMLLMMQPADIMFNSTNWGFAEWKLVKI